MSNDTIKVLRKLNKFVGSKKVINSDNSTRDISEYIERLVREEENRLYPLDATVGIIACAGEE